jgi:hypothetical protein
VVDRVHIADRTKVIQGITTTVVRDIVRTGGRVEEKTHDWYVADDLGNVWYFGERTAIFDRRGNVRSTEGSWESGVDGAMAGIIMPADPRPTDACRQELYPGHAEDQAWVVERGGRLSVPLERVRHVLRTFEWKRLEPRVVSAKLYAPDLGIVRERDVAGGDEDLSLVAFRSPDRPGRPPVFPSSPRRSPSPGRSHRSRDGPAFPERAAGLHPGTAGGRYSDSRKDHPSERRGGEASS